MTTRRSVTMLCLGLAFLTIPAAVFAQTPACSVMVYPKFVAPDASTGTPGSGTPIAVFAKLIPQAATLPDTYAVKFRGGDGLSRGLTWMPEGDFNPANRVWYGDAAAWLTGTRQYFFTNADPKELWIHGKVLNTSTTGPDTFRIRIRLLQPGTNFDSPVYEVTALDMSSNGGWIAGNVYSDASFSTPHQQHIVLAFKADTIASIYFSEDNKISEGYDSTDAGYFKMAVPAGNIDSIQVRDTLNNVVASYVQTSPPWTISAGQVTSVNLSDPIPPSIVWTSPAWGATGVGLNEPIVVAFSEPMDTGSINGYPSGNSFTFSWTPANDTLTLTPQFSYQNNTLYWIVVTAGTDLAGNSLPGLPDTAVYFTTLAYQGPTINVVEQPEDTYDGAGPFLVRAVITDPGKSLVADTLWYTDNTTNWWWLTHTNVTGDTFSYSIPGPLDSGTVIEYFIGAWDDGGNVAYAPGMYRGHQFRILDPMPPTGLTATPGDHQVFLEWAPPAEVLEYFNNNSTLITLQAGDIADTRFTPQHYPCKVEQVVSSWYYAIGADSVEVHVWADDGYGLPDRSTELIPPRVVMPLDYPNYTVIDISSDNLILSSGDFHVGYVTRSTEMPKPTCDGNGPGIRSMVYDSSAGTWGNLIINGTEYCDWAHRAAVSYSSYFKDQEPGKSMVETYYVFRSDVGGGPYGLLSNANGLAYTDNAVIGGNTYYYVVRLEYISPDAFSVYSNEASATPTGVEGPSTPLGVPTRFEMTANYPNPVRTSTTIKFGLPKESQVRVEVYNIAGQRVKTLANGKLNAGYHQVTWKGANEAGQKVAAGVYLVRMVTPEFNATRKMTVIR